MEQAVAYNALVQYRHALEAWYDGHPLCEEVRRAAVEKRDNDSFVRFRIQDSTIVVNRDHPCVAEHTRTTAEKELVRTMAMAALFASLSHDLRTPLATITGATSSLQQLGERMDAATRTDLLLSIEEGAARLGRFAANYST